VADRFITPEGLARIRAEYDELFGVERPKIVETVSWAASLGDRSENADYIYGKRRLREIDRRVRFLRKRLERVQVVDPAAQTRRGQVFFGATVTYARENDREVTVTIVGVDEADSGAGRISWVSPVARALLGTRVGDLVRLRTPQGVESIEVVAIRYPAS
jgi:transcription elongation factor GreB